MARSLFAADLLLNSSLSGPCLPETTRNVARDPWSKWTEERKNVIPAPYVIPAELVLGKAGSRNPEN